MEEDLYNCFVCESYGCDCISCNEIRYRDMYNDYYYYCEECDFCKIACFDNCDFCNKMRSKYNRDDVPYKKMYCFDCCIDICKFCYNEIKTGIDYNKLNDNFKPRIERVIQCLTHNILEKREYECDICDVIMSNNFYYNEETDFSVCDKCITPKIKEEKELTFINL